ncbi:MAG: OmpA family protein [Saprospiraceae bacterium]|nr:OmpA family protein [Saprospiraceae bacterium]MBK8849495.1 OmpA family protein [Saprospiraceae bacterium]
MTRKIYVYALLFLGGTLFAQDDMKKDQTDASFRMGQSNYTAKPKNAWELGVHAGHFFIDGDVDRTIPGGYGLGLHLRKAIHYSFSIRADLFYGSATGLEPQRWTHASVGEPVGGGLIEKEYLPYANNADGWFPSHKTTQVYGVMQGVLNIGNILFHQKNNKWNWYWTLGVGLSSHKTKLDLLDGNNQPYLNLLTTSGYSEEKFNTKKGRGEIKDALNNIYDGTYETEGPKKAGIFRLGDDTNIHVMFTSSVGVSRKLSKRINLGIEHQVMATDNDYLDGIRFRSEDDLSADVDLEHYTNLRLAINLGNLDKVTEPLYWVNPLDATMNDIAELKARPVLDLTDSDSDGIIDMLDQEVETPAGAPVDTRGVALDSDGDGVADYKDKEPYSPIGYEIGKDGVANVKKCESCLTEADVFRMIDSRTAGFKNDCGKWFLPMIHFDLDKSRIKPEFYGHLHHVASVLKQCPSACVSVVGHTDVRNSNNYNNMLSYNRAQAAVDYLVTNYGIDRSRLKLMYGGEDAPMVGKSKTETEHYMNRRVEFRLCEPTDAEMQKPEGKGGNSGNTSGNSGSIFKGNKNSGY